MIDTVDFLYEFIDDLPVGIASADTTGELPNHYNNFFTEMFGWSFEDIDTMEKWFSNAYPDEEYRAELIERWNALMEETRLQNKKYSSPMEVKVTCKDGSVKWCECSYYTKEQFLYGIFVDVSERKQVELKLNELSLMDPLTEIHNRRYFHNQYYDRWHLSQRTKTPLTIIICDIDDFKMVNDTYGHLMGDQVLATVAQTIATTLKRTTDFVARYGGEEFVIVSYDCNEACALDLCQTIQRNMEKLARFDMENKANYNGKLSYGVNTIIANSNASPEEFINNADKALYEAKNSGKNRIVVYKE